MTTCDLEFKKMIVDLYQSGETSSFSKTMYLQKQLDSYCYNV